MFVRLSVGIVALGITVAATAHSAPPSLTCRSAKNKLAGTYANCRAKAEAKFALSADGVARTAALQKCVDKYNLKWPSLESKASGAGDPCPSTGDQGAIQDVTDAYTSNVATALAGGMLFDCPGDLATCQADLTTCQAALSGTAVCGNGTLEVGEQCEVGTVNGQTCATQGFLGGTLRCGVGCALDTSGCYTTRFVDNGNGTVTDNQTRLQWEKKTTSSTDLHYVGRTLYWNYAGSYDAFDFLLELDTNTTSSFDPAHPHVNGGFVGHTDWRLPTIVELASIFDFDASGCGTGSPCIDPIFGPTSPEEYWSSTEDPSLGVWTVNFGGTFRAIAPWWSTSLTTPAHVRAVRSLP